MSSVKVRAAIDQVFCYWPLVAPGRSEAAAPDVWLRCISPSGCTGEKMDAAAHIKEHSAESMLILLHSILVY